MVTPFFTQNNMAKIVSFKKACELSKRLKKEKETVVFTSGCFDIYHIGHASFFMLLRKYFGPKAIIFVGVEPDKYISLRKGKNRPIFTQNTRAKVLSIIENFDYVVKLTYTKNFKHRHKKFGANFVAYGNNELIKVIREDLKSIGTEFVHLPHRIKKSSTSKIINILMSDFSS